ncbi:MAG: zinc metallopeptidase [Bacteroidetes bacterium]|nr:MAG: zinc metallopeptidase [Bacteroidota bacterium]TAG87173.1 MAG: zinc metallopeptidase [Bacteroidota bacterium]
MLWVIFGVTMIASLIVHWRLNSKFKKYAQIGLRSNLTGAEIAAMMLQDHRINDVQITCVEGHLTDHYNPADKTINLSAEVFYGNSAASAAVAAHECGHAVQHATAYAMLEFRSMMVPLQNISGWFLNILFIVVFFGGYFFLSFIPITTVLLIVIAAHGIITLFSFITLPVEFDASKRALVWMTDRGIVTREENAMAKDALNTAALTYVIAALGSLATLMYYVVSYLGINNND